MGAGNPRNSRRGAKERKTFSQIPLEMQTTEAYNALPASALRVLTLAVFFAFTAKKKLDGYPAFDFTNTTAKKMLLMNQATFSRAKALLIEKGFLVCVHRGGLRGANGTASLFRLSGDWKK